MPSVRAAGRQVVRAKPRAWPFTAAHGTPAVPHAVVSAIDYAQTYGASPAACTRLRQACRRTAVSAGQFQMRLLSPRGLPQSRGARHAPRSSCRAREISPIQRTSMLGWLAVPRLAQHGRLRQRPNSSAQLAPPQAAGVQSPGNVTWFLGCRPCSKPTHGTRCRPAQLAQRAGGRLRLFVRFRRQLTRTATPARRATRGWREARCLRGGERRVKQRWRGKQQRSIRRATRRAASHAKGPNLARKRGGEPLLALLGSCS